MTFEPEESGTRQEPPRSTFKRSKPKPPATSPAEPSTPEEPPRKKKRKLAKLVADGRPWQAWIDPASLLWLPLPIVLALFTGSAAFSFILPPVANEEGSTNVNFIFLAFSLVLAFLPAALLLSHWMQIGADWAQGNTADPPWPDFDVGAILGDFVNSLLALVFAVVCSGRVFFLQFDQPTTKTAIAALLFAVYFSIALLAVSLQSHAMASNPVSILMALLRMSRGRLAFLVETAIHLAIGVLIWRSIFLVWEKAWDVGVLLWGFLWTYAFFSGARLMRAAGTYYRQNAKRIGWFT